MPQGKQGVLLVNLGTPSAPTTQAVKKYLAEFLHDHRVVDLSRWIWCPLLHGIILPRRAPKVARLYQAIWQEAGSPLRVISLQQQSALAARLPDVPVELAMTYGEPSLEEAWQRLQAQGVTRLMVLPLFPQYSASTTGAVWDQLARFFARQERVPSLHFLRDYATHPDYIAALAESVKASFTQHGEPDLLLFSYHGIPQRYADRGDDYPQRCELTTQRVAEALQLSSDQYRMTYQSRFGREPWLMPYTDETLQKLPEQGIRSIQVICPGFASDCLETLEEIEVQNRDLFLAAGGGSYRYIPALNAEVGHIDLLESLCRQGLSAL